MNEEKAIERVINALESIAASLEVLAAQPKPKSKKGERYGKRT